MKKRFNTVIRRKTVVIELACVVLGVLLSAAIGREGIWFALAIGGAASALVALLIDVRSALDKLEDEHQKILNFNKMISPLICRWVELYIYMSDKDLVRSSALANKVQNSSRCGVDLMAHEFQLDDMVNMFQHPYLLRSPMNTPVVELFVDVDAKLEDSIELFLNCNALSDFDTVKKVLFEIVSTKRAFDVSRHILEDKVTTLGGVTFWDQFKANAGSLVAQFAPNGSGNPIYNHYFVFKELLKVERRLLVS